MNGERSFPLERIAGVFLIVGGLWHAAAPWVLGYSDFRPAAISNPASGLTLALVGVLMVVLRGSLWLCGVAALIGVWVLIAPQVFGVGGPNVATMEALWGGPLTIAVAAVAALARSWGRIAGSREDEGMERGPTTA